MILDAFLNYGGGIENPANPLTAESGWGMLGGTNMSSAGTVVSTDAALGFHAFYRGVDLVSSYVGKLPVHIEKKVNGGWEPDTEHPNYSMVLDRPSPEMNALTHRKTAEGHRMYEGNAYVFCRRRGDGQILEFVLLNPCQVWPIRINGVLQFVTYRDDGSMQLLRRQDVMHLKGLSKDGMIGLPLRTVGRESLASGIALIEYGNRFFRNGAMPLVVLEIPAGMNPEAKEELAKNWAKIHGSLSNSHRTGVVTGGTKVNVLSAKANESQLTEQKNFSLIEVSNLTGAPPHKLGEGSRQAYNSLEQENQSFLDDGLDWRLVDWEQEYEDKILTEKQKRERTHRVRFDREQLVRADLNAKANYDSKSVAGLPWRTIDEVRMANHLNRLPGSQGDKLIIPKQSSSPGEGAPPEGAPPAPRQTTPPRQPSAQAHVDLLGRSLRKMADRVARNSKRLSKDPAAFMEWLDEIGDHSRAVMVEEFGATLAACRSVLVIEDSAETLADRLIELAGRELLELSGSVTGDGLEGAVSEWSGRFAGARMESLARELAQEPFSSEVAA